MFKITGLALILFFQSSAFSSGTLTYKPTSEQIKISGVSKNTIRLLEDIDRMLPESGEVKFSKDIVFEVGREDYKKEYSGYTLQTMGEVRRQTFICDIKLSKQITERSFLRAGAPLKIKNVEYLVFPRTFGSSFLRSIKVNFDHQNVSAMTCKLFSGNAITMGWGADWEDILSDIQVLTGLKAFMNGDTLIRHPGVGL